MIIKKRWPFIGLLAIFLIVGAYALVAPRQSAGDEAFADFDTGACTVIMVAKGASADGSTLTTHTCDCGMCDWT
jgi:hypothetical protein